MDRRSREYATDGTVDDVRELNISTELLFQFDHPEASMTTKTE
jgi:hypothetical protein